MTMMIIMMGKSEVFFLSLSPIVYSMLPSDSHDGETKLVESVHRFQHPTASQ